MYGLSERALGALCALGSAAAWAVITLQVRRLSPVVSAFTINALRSSVAGVLLVGWVVIERGIGGLTSMSALTFWLLVASIVVGSAFGDTVFFEASRRIGLARAMTISTTYPLIAAVLAAALLGEWISARVALGSALSLVGLAVIVSGRPDQVFEPFARWRGFAAAGLASLSWATSVVLMRIPLHEVDALTAQAVRLPAAGLLMFMTPWARRGMNGVRGGGRGLAVQMLFMGVLTVASSVLFVAGLKHAGVAISTVLSSTAPMFAIPLGAVFLGERLAPRTVVGALVTVAGLAVLEL